MGLASLTNRKEYLLCEVSHSWPTQSMLLYSHSLIPISP